MPVKKREDVHSPKNLIPKDYEYVACFSAKNVDEPQNLENRKILQKHMEKTGGKFSDHWHGGTCAVCGAAAANVAVFYHKPSNTYIYTGSECADKISKSGCTRIATIAHLAIGGTWSTTLVETNILRFSRSEKDFVRMARATVCV